MKKATVIGLATLGAIVIGSAVGYLIIKKKCKDLIVDDSEDDNEWDCTGCDNCLRCEYDTASTGSECVSKSYYIYKENR